MPRKKVTFVKTKEVKEGKFKGLQQGVKSKKMSEKRAQKKQAKGQGFISKAYGSNPIEMSPYKMESAGQEKYNLLHDNPVAKHGSWMSKHSKSAFQMGHESPAKMHKDDHVDYAAKLKEYDRKQGLLDPKTGERKKKHTFDYNYIKDEKTGAITSKKTGEKSFVTAGGKKLPLGPGSPAGKHCM